MITYKKGSLFDAPKGSWLVHACNTQGIWGSGIAAEFKKRFPEGFKEYHKFCTNQLGKIAGMSYLTKDNVGCLFTSEGFGGAVDPPEVILKNTHSALIDFFRAYVFEDRSWTVHSNKFNSGLFNVPWEDTENILKNVLARYHNVEWVVWEP